MESANDSLACQQQHNSSKETHIVSVDDKKVLFQESDKTLLTCLEDSEVEIHYHCRDGFCGACRVTLTEGEIHYPNGEPLAFVADGEILPCCCVPKTDITLVIE